ncbi:hypothetical protein C8A01DRAFT_41675 [Parachaetomium inaequale]|uniref:Uncharacterized protein n=1 Tax=Parachaetomium inaequale TaxID=2588326 RepID=A0AAN6SLV2_9PEZI|nr:hypothetical protein C8A01DRAFT_41675 [Parachaetomium inaequale]
MASNLAAYQSPTPSQAVARAKCMDTAEKLREEFNKHLAQAPNPVGTVGGVAAVQAAAASLSDTRAKRAAVMKAIEEYTEKARAEELKLQAELEGLYPSQSSFQELPMNDDLHNALTRLLDNEHLRVASSEPESQGHGTASDSAPITETPLPNPQETADHIAAVQRSLELEAKVLDLQHALDTTGTRLETVEKERDEAKNNNSVLQTMSRDLGDRIAALRRRAESLEADKKEACARIEELEAGQRDKVQLETEIRKHKSRIQSLEDSAGRDKGRIKQLEQNVQRYADRIQELEGDIQRHQMTVESLEDGDDEHKAWINELEHEIGQYKGRILELTATIESRDRRITELEAVADQMQEQVRNEKADCENIWKILEETTKAKHDGDGRHVAEVQQLRAEIDRLKGAVEEQRRKTTHLETQNKDLEKRRISDIGRLEYEADGLTEDLVKVQEQLVKANERAGVLQVQLDHANTTVNNRGHLLQEKAEQISGLLVQLDGKTAEASSLSRQLQDKTAEAGQLSNQLQSKNAELGRLSDVVGKLESELQGKTAEANEVDKLKSEVQGQTAEVGRLSEQLQIKGEKVGSLSDAVDKLKGQLQGKAAEVTTLSDQLQAKEEDVARSLDAIGKLKSELQNKSAEAEHMSTRLQSVEAEVRKQSESLREKASKAVELEQQLQAKSAEAQDQAGRVETLTQQAQDSANKIEDLRQQLQEKEGEAKSLGHQLRRQTTEMEGLEGELERERAAIVAFCSRAADVEMDAAEWLRTWGAVQELTELPWGQYATRFWSVDQTYGDVRQSPKARGLQTLCLHLIAALGGPWDNKVLALAGLLWDELDVQQPLPVSGLLKVLSATTEGARAHRDHVVLVAIWQVARFLEEAFQDEPRFGERRQSLDERLQHSPWCQTVTQAIAEGTVSELCSTPRGQLYHKRGLGVLMGPLKGQFMAFDIQQQRLWMFADVHIKFRILPDSDAVIIPGTVTVIPACLRWWLNTYNIW